MQRMEKYGGTIGLKKASDVVVAAGKEKMRVSDGVGGRGRGRRRIGKCADGVGRIY